MTENIRIGNPSESVDELYDNEDNPNYDLHEDPEEQTENRYTGRSFTYLVDEIIKLGNPTEPMFDVDNNEDINKDFDDPPPEPMDDLDNKNMHQDNEDETENQYAGRSILDIADKIINFNVLDSDELVSGQQLYKCEE